MIELVKEKEGLDEKQTTYDLVNDVYVSKESFQAALVAVDSCLSGTEHALKTGKAGYAIVRPPGHHAHCDLSSGFCFFNNVAIAANHAASQGKKVLIFDWDIHQGDGTQTLFYERSDIMLMSLHRFDG